MSNPMAVQTLNYGLFISYSMVFHGFGSSPIYGNKPHLFCGPFVIFINFEDMVIWFGEWKIGCEIRFSLKFPEKFKETDCPITANLIF